jgi:hypothetical protein
VILRRVNPLGFKVYQYFVLVRECGEVTLFEKHLYGGSLGS